MLFPPKVVCGRLICFSDVSTFTGHKQLFRFHHGNIDSSTLWFPSSGLGLHRNLEGHFPRLDLLALGEHTLALILEVKVRGKAVVPSDYLTSVLKNSCLYYQNCRRTAGGKKRSLRQQNCSFGFP
jgi:hypothetical protein